MSRAWVIPPETLGMAMNNQKGGVLTATGYSPSCLMPVSMPPMPMKAGGMQVRRAKNRMTSEESLRLMP
jgi:hypothetical protein